MLIQRSIFCYLVDEVEVFLHFQFFDFPKVLRTLQLGLDPNAEGKRALTCTTLFVLTKLGLTKNPRLFQSGVTHWPKIFFEKTITRKD